ncbi:MAG: methionine adenosyltransferase [bacterium]
MPGQTEALFIRAADRLPMKDQPIEIVEKKGKGHPDTICDTVMEEASFALNSLYQKYAGRILHYNLDKGLLAAGKAAVAFGGGEILTPMSMIIGDRATFQYAGKELPVWDVVLGSAKNCIGRCIRYLDADQHLTFQNGLRPGSGELAGIFTQSGERAQANDTSAAVGFAPRTAVEEMVLALEEYITSQRFQLKFPAAGEDVKIMAIRKEQSVDLTVALALVDRFITSESDYFNQKEALSRKIADFIRSRFDFASLTVRLNTLDQQGKGTDGLYLTVTGTSAEQGDSGQVGRGNQINGLICLNRPQSNEAAAGKNPVSHVGKIYNYLAFLLARDLYDTLEAADEILVWMTSRIGESVDRPHLVVVEVVPQKGRECAAGYRDIISSCLRHHLERIPELCQELATGKVALP